VSNRVGIIVAGDRSHEYLFDGMLFFGDLIFFFWPFYSGPGWAILRGARRSFYFYLPMVC